MCNLREYNELHIDKYMVVGCKCNYFSIDTKRLQMKRCFVIAIVVFMFFTSVSCVVDPYHGHEWVEKEVTEATCLDDGAVDYTCKGCDETKTEVIKALGHNFVDGICSRCKANEEIVNNSMARIGYAYYSTLRDAIDNLKPGDTLTMLKDFEYSDSSEMVAEKALAISIPCTIDGNGKSIFCSLDNKSLPDDLRLLSILDLNEGNLTIKNLTLKSDSYGQWFRGLNIARSSSSSIVLDNVDIYLPHYYALNLTSNNHDLMIELMNGCEISGWATIYNRGNDIKLNATNCTFDSYNPVIAEGHDNSFTSIVLSEYYMSNVPISENNAFTFDNCTFSAKKHEDTKVKQDVFDLRVPANNKLYINDCTFSEVAEPVYITSAFDTDYMESMEDRNRFEFSNKVFIDGIDVTNDKNMVENYLDKEINKIEDYADDYPYNPIVVLFEVSEGGSEASLKINDGHSDYLLTSEKTLDNPETWKLAVQKIVH